MNITEIDHKGYQEQVNNPDSSYNRSLNAVMANQAEWTNFEGVDVLRVKGSDYIGVPATGRKNAANFIIIDVNDRSEAVCQLSKKEVRGWLCKTAIG